MKKKAGCSCAIIIAFCLFLTCLAYECAVLYDFLAEFPGIGWSETIVDVDVPFDVSILDAPTISDLQDLATSLLKANGWTASTNLASVELAGISCSAPVRVGYATLWVFRVYLYHGIPSTDFGEINLERATGMATISIAYQRLRWRSSTMKSTGVNAELEEALQSIDYFGQPDASYPSDTCRIYAWLNKYTWNLELSTKEEGRWWTAICSATVHARSGKATCEQECCR